MRKLAVNTFMSLDGVMQSPGGPEEDPTGGFTHGGWGVNYFDEEMMGQVAEADPGLIQSLLEHDLIDEFRIWIFPVVIGTGKRLFGDGTIPAALELVDSKGSKTGVTINTYRRAGDIDPGSFEFDEPTEAELERRKRLAAA